MVQKINSPYVGYINPKVFGEPDISRLLIFDTTLRDGEQTPGAAQGPQEKAYLSRFIEALGVDAMEVSFAISDPNEIGATHQVINALGQHEDIPSSGRDVLIYSLARALPADVDAAWEAVQSARFPGIHTFVSTSDDHRMAKFPGKKPEDLKFMLTESAIRAAEKFVKTGKYGMVEISAEDALRTPIDFLLEIYSKVIHGIQPYFGKVGFTFNIPDTVGVVVNPEHYTRYIRELRKNIPGIERVILSAHIHNDHGLAVASSMASVHEGVRQIECTVNGIGERAGNTSLEQIAMIIAHDDIANGGEGSYGVRTGVNTKKIYTASVEIAAATGFHPGRTQPVVGSNVRSHEAGIHQHGQLRGIKIGKRRVYEGVSGDEIGGENSKFPLGRRSGINALDYHLTLLGYDLDRVSGGGWDSAESARVYEAFIGFAQDQRTVTHRELRTLMNGLGYSTQATLPLEYISHARFNSRGPSKPEGAIVSLRIDDGPVTEFIGHGEGEVEAVVNAMKIAVGNNLALKNYRQANRNTATATGERSYARTEIILQDDNGRFISGEGYDLDIGRSAAKAFANAFNLDLLVRRYEARQQIK